VGHSKGSAKKKVYSYEFPHQKITINNLMMHLKLLGKHEQAKPKARDGKKFIIRLGQKLVKRGPKDNANNQ
jgi:hypothetical protein